MLVTTNKIFHRQELASNLANYLVSADGSSGLFVAAPRRTGKSTFIREDLIPQLKLMRAEVVYADLLEDKVANPGHVIVNAIRESIFKFDAKRTGKGETITNGSSSFSSIGQEIKLVLFLRFFT